MHNRPQCCSNSKQLGRALQENWRMIPREIIHCILARPPCPEGVVHASMLSRHKSDTDPLYILIPLKCCFFLLDFESSIKYFPMIHAPFVNIYILKAIL